VGRYLDIRPDDEGLPAELVLAVGDVVRVAATGGGVRSGTGIELLGVLTEGVVGLDGSVLTPLGPPGAVLFRAREPGRAGGAGGSGDPVRDPLTPTHAVRVEP
jgi:hypothetical protein